MDASIFVLASASVPLGLIALHDFRSDRRVGGMFGMTSAAWSVSGVVLVYLGVPGLLFFPGLFAIMISSALVQARGGGGRSQYLKAALLSTLLAIVTLGLVVL